MVANAIIPTSGKVWLKNVEYATVSNEVLQALVEAAIMERAIVASESIINNTPMPTWAEKWTAFSITLSLRQLKDVDGRPLYIPHLFDATSQTDGVQARVHAVMDDAANGMFDLPIVFTNSMQTWHNEVEGVDKDAMTYFPDTGVMPVIQSTARVTASIQPASTLPSVGLKFLLPD